MSISLLTILYIVHVSCVCLSIAGFIFRGALLVADSPYLQTRWLKITPHIIDTVLLASAIGLAIQIEQYPFIHAWLSAKVIALIFYIGIGIITFRLAQTTTAKVIGICLALGFAIYIVMVAFTKSPLLNLF